MDWFRMYHGVLDDPKVQELEIATRWHWLEVLCLASQHTPRGTLPDARTIAYRLHLSRNDCETLLTSLQEAGLLDLIGGCLVPHNWTERQRASDESAARVAAWRERKRAEQRNGSGNVTVSYSRSLSLENKSKSKRGNENGNVTPGDMEQQYADQQRRRIAEKRAYEDAQAAIAQKLAAERRERLGQREQPAAGTEPGRADAE